MRQPLVLRFDALPFARVRRQRCQLVDHPPEAVLFGDRAGGHAFGVLARALGAFPRRMRAEHIAPRFAKRAVFVEEFELGSWPQQHLMRVLTLHIEQLLAELTELRQRDAGTVDKCAAAAARIDRAAYVQQLGRVAGQVLLPAPGRDLRSGPELCGDVGARRALAHDVGLAPLAQRQQ